MKDPTTISLRVVVRQIQPTLAAMESAIFPTFELQPQRFWNDRDSASSGSSSLASGSFAVSRILAERLGITVIATSKLKLTPLLIANAISRKSCPASSSTKRIGRNTATVVRVLARTAPQTSTAPSCAARRRLFPIWRWR